ncbi:MAG TPA: hypothetical protein PKC30_14540 [Saprospiraceae bacterium]|nr:hypothetical protein [Saprospiraceae bacterium]
MIDKIILQYPTWYLWLCIFAGLFISGILYYRDKRFSVHHRLIPAALFLFRFLAVGVVVFLLLNPLIKDTSEFIQMPLVVVVKDISESIERAMDKESLEKLQSGLKELSKDLEKKYKVVELSFGGEVYQGLSDTFPEKITNISALFHYISDNYADQNLGAVVIASDGIYNEGIHPIYSTGRIAAPVYAVALGDTTRRMDLSISNVFANNLVYFGDKFVMQVDILAFRSSGQRSKLSLFRIEGDQRELLTTRDIQINLDDFFTTEEFILDADRPGIVRYQVLVSPLSGESSTQNNLRDHFIQVLDARQRILIYGQAPHPDIAALGQVINKNKNYSTDVKMHGDPIRHEEYDLIIFHNLPGQGKDISSDIRKLSSLKIPYFLIVGNQTYINSLNRIQDMVHIQRQGNYQEEVTPVLSGQFRMFTISDRLKSTVRNFPPVLTPFGEFTAGPNTSTLLYQKIKGVDTQFPLFIFQEKEGLRTGLLAGEGIWRWRMYDFLHNSNEDALAEIIGKSIQYISVKRDSRNFIVQSSRRLYRENERILFTAQLYNDSYELVNEPEVFLTITGSDREEYQFIFSRTGDYYSLDAGLLKPGSYQFRARTIYGGQELEDKGLIVVQDIQLELFNLEARHEILYSLAEQKGGRLVYPNQISELKDEILNADRIKPVVYENVQTTPMVDKKWLFFMLLFFLSTEWFVRRYMGSY